MRMMQPVAEQVPGLYAASCCLLLSLTAHCSPLLCWCVYSSVDCHLLVLEGGAALVNFVYLCAPAFICLSFCASLCLPSAYLCVHTFCRELVSSVTLGVSM